MELKLEDLRIETYSTGGFNSYPLAVIITHIPSGFTEYCDKERSQHVNKALAMQRLAERVNRMDEKDLPKRNMWEKEITALAQGKDVQYRNSATSREWTLVEPSHGFAIFDVLGNEFRTKPETHLVETTLWYDGSELVVDEPGKGQSVLLTLDEDLNIIAIALKTKE